MNRAETCSAAGLDVPDFSGVLLDDGANKNKMVRKAIFSLQLWVPRCQRISTHAQGSGTPGRAKNVNINKRHVHCSRSRSSATRTLSATRVGWLNARSLSNKTTVVYETIDDRHLDVLAVTETWHRSNDDLILRLAAPPDYTQLSTPSAKPIRVTEVLSSFTADDSVAPR